MLTLQKTNAAHLAASEVIATETSVDTAAAVDATIIVEEDVAEAEVTATATRTVETVDTEAADAMIMRRVSTAMLPADVTNTAETVEVTDAEEVVATEAATTDGMTAPSTRPDRFLLIDTIIVARHHRVMVGMEAVPTQLRLLMLRRLVATTTAHAATTRFSCADRQVG